MNSDEHRFWPTHWVHLPDDRAMLPNFPTICVYLCESVAELLFLVQMNFVRPGIASGGTSTLPFQSRRFCGAISSFEFNAISHVTSCPV